MSSHLLYRLSPSPAQLSLLTLGLYLDVKDEAAHIVEVCLYSPS